MSSFLGRELINFVHEELPRTLPQQGSLLLVQRVQDLLSSSAVGPPPAIAPSISSVLQTLPLVLSTSPARASSDAVSSQFSDMSPGTVPRERQTFSLAETRKRPPPQLFALFVVGTHPLGRFSLGVVRSSGWPDEMARSLSQRERGRTKGDLP